MTEHVMKSHGTIQYHTKLEIPCVSASWLSLSHVLCSCLFRS